MKRLFALLLLSCVPMLAQTTVFNCSVFTTTGTCGANSGGGQPFKILGGTGSVSGSQIILIPTGTTHGASALNFQTLVDDRAFTATYTFVTNGQNGPSFVLQNSNNTPGYNGPDFFNGAGCEAGFFQAFNPVAPNNIFAMEWDSYSPLNLGGSFTYSSAQIYQSAISPCIPNDSGNTYPNTSKLSTSPVPLNSPATSQNTTTGHTYSATVTYDGSNFTTSLFDVTAGGSCPGSTCFTHTWSNVSIPSIVNGTTAYVGLNGATGLTSSFPLYVKSFVYTVNTATASPGSTPPAAGGTTAANPTFSPAAGSYSGAQAVSISSTTSGNNICYTLGVSGLTVLPYPNNVGGCASGTLYTGPVSVSSSQTLYATAGTNKVGLPSGIVQGAYTIGGTPTLATPTFSPAAGTYISTQTATIGCAVGATCVYTTDGSTPTAAPPGTPTHGTVYTTPITVSSSQTINAIATEVGFFNSAVASAAYVIAPPAATPTFSPVGGTYTSVQTVTISTTTPSPTIHYTTDSSTPTLASPLYTGPIAVSVSETVKAIATASGFSSSAVGTASYVINLPTASAPTFSPVAGTYATAQSVSLSTTTSGGVICYKIGSAPPAPTTAGVCPSGTGYATPISVASSQTLFAYTTKASFLTSTTSQAAYVIEVPASTPTFSPGAGTYTSVQTVNISSVTPGATIFYSFNCTVFTSSPAPPISVSGSGTVCAYATAPGFTQSVTGSAAYVINLPPAATPTFTPAAGTYTSVQNVTLASTTAGAFIFYTTDGSTPTPSSTPYTGPISVGSPQTINAIATAAGFSNSAVGTALYMIDLPVVDTPDFSPCSPGPAPDCGTYASAQTVTISSTTVGASIYYTTNGSTPTTSSTLYTGPITVATSQTVKAIGVLAGMEDSDVGSAAYVITAIQLNCTILPGTTISGTVTIK